MTRRRRARIREREFPEAWRAIMERNLPIMADLDPAERARLEGHVQVFLHEKRFEGVHGLEITDEVRVTVAGQACLLVLGRDGDDYFPHVTTIIVYPQEYADPTGYVDEHGVVSEGADVRVGESWYRGSVVLSWADAREDGRFHRDGRNVVLHEFAHQLDAASGHQNGAPQLPSRERREEWAEVFGAAYEDLVARDEAGRWTAVDPYGAENPAEFFAVATEEFFERPAALRNQYADVYEQLVLYYGQDPLARRED